MHVRVSIFASALLVLLIVSACEDSNGVSQPGTTRPSPFRSQLVSVEPAAIIPQFVRNTSCLTFPPFQTRFNLLLRTDRDLFVQRFRFAFRDRFGGRALPVPIPTSPAVPIPEELPFHGTLVSPPFSRFDFLLNFNCGVPADGTLSIEVETTDREGNADIATVSVRVG